MGLRASGPVPVLHPDNEKGMPMFSTNDHILIASVVIYLVVSVAIGLFAARRVSSSTDYMVAGRSLPLYITVATVFATWFGSETVLGTSSTFITDGLGGIVADPFGAALCLVLVGVFFAVPLYKMNLLTIGDYYRQRYSRDVEVSTSLVIMVSYLGWVAAQLAALGLVFNVISHGMISRELGMAIGAVIVITYTLYGGMWSVALTDFFQMTLIMIGLVFIAWLITGRIEGGAATVLEHATEAGKMNILPEANLAGILGFIGALITLGLGSIPQQDVFQRVMSAKDAKTARNSAILGGVLYLLFAFIPIYLAYSAFIIDPAMVNRELGEGGDSQMVLPTLILQHTPIFAQILFFGALLSAIMSTASGTLLAPSTLFGENILRPILKPRDDAHLLKMVRCTVLLFGLFVTIFAYYQMSIEATIFEMVENAYKIVLCGAFVPLAFGLYWKRANLMGARLSMILGISSWIIWEFLEYSYASLDGATGWSVIGLADVAGVCPPQLAGFIMALVGMLLGGYLFAAKTTAPVTPVN
jgi:SSS family solute:Na+ symporter